ncbi:MAG: GNAT family N-acetyltransferase [Lachnospiraceae bacterium]|nr:GNAT family N-acetyltransferase [Lachnospiraceae bacterium]
MSSLVYRKITPADDAAVAALVRSNLEKAGLDIPGTAYFDEALDHLSDVYGKDDSEYYVLTDADGKVVGGIGYGRLPFMQDTAELQKLYLDDSVKGRGLGYEMIGYIEDRMRDAGYKRSYLETHDALQTAMHIYVRSGYKEIERPAQTGHSSMTRFYLKELL